MGKKRFHWQESQKIDKKLFLLARKSVCSTRDEAFVKRYVPTTGKSGITSGKKIEGNSSR